MRRLAQSRALFCENTNDSVTRPLAAHRIAKAHPIFRRRGFEVTALTGAANNYANFERISPDPRVVHISGVGHGNSECDARYRNESLICMGTV